MGIGVYIVKPHTENNYVSHLLVNLTEELIKQGIGSPSFGLGGSNGYGVEFENDVFMMHPFCWCEQVGCKWCCECECKSELECIEKCSNIQSAPNFLHKPTGFKVHWYKYIGRGMEHSPTKYREFLNIINDCIGSVKTLKPELFL